MFSESGQLTKRDSGEIDPDDGLALRGYFRTTMKGDLSYFHEGNGENSGDTATKRDLQGDNSEPSVPK